jgi:hypothetical protein
MTVLLNLRGRPLKALTCGNCKGSHSDHKIRTFRADDQPDVALALTTRS